MKGIARYIRPYYRYILLTVTIKFLATVTELMIPKLLEIMLDEAVVRRDVTLILLLGAGMVFSAAICVVGNIVANRMSSESSGRITRAIRYDLFSKLSEVSTAQFDRLTTPSAVSRLTGDTYNVNQFLARMQRLGIRGPILLIGGLAIMLLTDAALALVLVAALPLIALLVWFVTRRSLPLYSEEQQLSDRVVGTVRENITGIRVIKALDRSAYEKERFEEINETLAETGSRASSVVALTGPVSSLILNVGLTLVILVGALRVQNAEIGTGLLISFQSYFIMILNAMMGITKIFTMWSKGEASAARVSEVLALPEDLPVRPLGEGAASSGDPSPLIEFRHVSFSYHGSVPSLHDVSFTLFSGETLGIIGPTGSGKSTLLSLLLRLYDPSEGEILLRGRDLRTYGRGELASLFGVAMQNGALLRGSIADNIRYFRPIPDERLAAVASSAQALPFILEKGGMDFEVAARGNNLSGGQKQRLLLSRALAGDPEILVLDDAMSALDYRTDALLRRELSVSYGDKTKIIVAQRAGSLRHSDRILVLEEGECVAYGRHDTLMETCPLYRSISNSQMAEGGDHDGR